MRSRLLAAGDAEFVLRKLYKMRLMRQTEHSTKITIWMGLQQQKVLNCLFNQVQIIRAAAFQNVPIARVCCTNNGFSAARFSLLLNVASIHPSTCFS
jgi:hypothetical protein